MRAATTLLTLSLVACTSSSLLAVEQASRPGGPGRLMMSFDVEVLTLKPDDRAAVALWTRLAAVGFHVVSTSTRPDGATVLFLERVGTPGQIHVSPAAATDAAEAEALKAQIKVQQQERQAAAAPGAAGQPSPSK